LRRGRKIVAVKEEDIYAALGLPFIAPELREGQGEIKRALKRKLRKLVSEKDICGILHAHTDLSDGVDTLGAMAEATRTRGYVYFGIADHSKSAHYKDGPICSNALDCINGSEKEIWAVYMRKEGNKDIILVGEHEQADMNQIKRG
jgi:hypothetical protein